MSRIRVGLIRRIGHCVSVCTVWRHLVAAGYRSRHPDRCPSVKAAACWHTGARLEPSALVSTDIYWWAQGQPLNCNGCAWMFCHVVESLVDGCLRESGGSKWPETDLELISKYHMQPLLMFPVLLTVYQHELQVAIIRNQEPWASIWMSSAIFSHY